MSTFPGTDIGNFVYMPVPGVQLLGCTEKNVAESCEISPYVTMKEKSTSPYFFRFQKFTFDFDHCDSLVRLFTALE